MNKLPHIHKSKGDWCVFPMEPEAAKFCRARNDGWRVLDALVIGRVCLIEMFVKTDGTKKQIKKWNSAPNWQKVHFIQEHGAEMCKPHTPETERGDR